MPPLAVPAPAPAPVRPTMCFDIVGRTMLCVHGAAAPADAEWEAYLELSKRLDFVGVVVLTVNPAFPGPSSAQRAKVAKVMNQRGTVAPVAVVTPSAFLRGIVTVIGWMQRGN